MSVQTAIGDYLPGKKEMSHMLTSYNTLLQSEPHCTELLDFQVSYRLYHQLPIAARLHELRLSAMTIDRRLSYKNHNAQSCLACEFELDVVTCTCGAQRKFLAEKFLTENTVKVRDDIAAMLRNDSSLRVTSTNADGTVGRAISASAPFPGTELCSCGKPAIDCDGCCPDHPTQPIASTS
jgi:hypothetical protein